MAGIVINLPWAKGDKFWVEGTVAEGAAGYVGWSGGIVGTTNTYGRFNGGNVAAAWAIDSIFGTPRPRPAGACWPAADAVLLDRGGARALLDAGVAHVSLRQLDCRGLQRDRDDAVLLVTAEPDPSRSAGCASSP